MAVSSIKAVLTEDIQKVWEIVTSLEDCLWRSDLSRVEILDEKKFVEYTEKGYPTTFTVTEAEPCKRYEFDMENDNMRGYWSGIFTDVSDQNKSRTEIVFTEEVYAKKLFMKPFVKSYLKKQQEQYVADLKKYIESSEV